MEPCKLSLKLSCVSEDSFMSLNMPSSFEVN